MLIVATALSYSVCNVDGAGACAARVFLVGVDKNVGLVFCIADAGQLVRRRLRVQREAYCTSWTGSPITSPK